MSEKDLLFIPDYAHQLNIFILKSLINYSFLITNNCIYELEEVINFIIDYYLKNKKINTKKIRDRILKNLNLFIKTISNIQSLSESNFIDINYIYDLYNKFSIDINN